KKTAPGPGSLPGRQDSVSALFSGVRWLAGIYVTESTQCRMPFRGPPLRARCSPIRPTASAPPRFSLASRVFELLLCRACDRGSRDDPAERSQGRTLLRKKQSQRAEEGSCV